MARRLNLHEELCSVLGSRNVYFQPPESVKLKYDCIIYSVRDRNDIRADDRLYRDLVDYEVMAIYRDPDSDLPEKLMQRFLRCRHERHFTVDNLHHDVFIISY